MTYATSLILYGLTQPIQSHANAGDSAEDLNGIRNQSTDRSAGDETAQASAITPMVARFTCASRRAARKAGFFVTDSAGKSMRWAWGHSIPSAWPMPASERSISASCWPMGRTLWDSNALRSSSAAWPKPASSPSTPQHPATSPATNTAEKTKSTSSNGQIRLQPTQVQYLATCP